MLFGQLFLFPGPEGGFMPFVELETLSLYYELSGSGEPLLLISGLGGGTWSWYGQLPFLQKRFQIITSDNRGAGRSSIPQGPYRMAQFASDALAVLDHLGIERVFVLGLSMGGMIAQELVLMAPQRVRALILGCTHCGGERRIPPDPDTLAAFVNNEGLNQEQIITKNLPFFFSRGCFEQHPDVIEEYRKIQVAAPIQPECAFVAQLQAISTFDCSTRVNRIKVPTLVISGTEDQLVPLENARILAAEIPGARLEILEHAGHALHAECRDRLNQLTVEFFESAAK
jgi:3-oxoadipate enol-lactonase